MARRVLCEPHRSRVQDRSCTSAGGCRQPSRLFLIRGSDSLPSAVRRDAPRRALLQHRLNWVYEGTGRKWCNSQYPVASMKTPRTCRARRDSFRWSAQFRRVLSPRDAHCECARTLPGCSLSSAGRERRPVAPSPLPLSLPSSAVLSPPQTVASVR